MSIRCDLCMNPAITTKQFCCKFCYDDKSSILNMVTDLCYYHNISQPSSYLKNVCYICNQWNCHYHAAKYLFSCINCGETYCDNCFVDYGLQFHSNKNSDKQIVNCPKCSMLKCRLDEYFIKDLHKTILEYCYEVKFTNVDDMFCLFKR